MSDASPCGTESICLNVRSHIECVPGQCPAKQRCQNQYFRRGTQLSLQVRKTEGKGWGLFAMEEIRAGQFIIEYVGEVIDGVELEKRFKAIKDGNFYFFGLDKEIYIDSRVYGNVSRFGNHSCDPNAVAQKWIVNENGREHIRVGLFAKGKIHVVSYTPK